jgi:hypothetical protein
MSQWEDLDPDQKRRRMLDDPAQAPLLVAADKRLIAAMMQDPIDLKSLSAALRDHANPDRIVVNGFPALHVAVHRRDIQALSLLLDHGVSVNDWDAEGATALDEAHRKRFTEGVKKLKQFSAETRLVIASGEDQPDPVEAASYQIRMNKRLLKMIERGEAEQVQQAIDLGADVNMQDGYSFRPPLHTAALQCDAEKVKIILDAGADVFRRTKTGEDVLDILWQATPRRLFGPEWQQVYDVLTERGYNNLFARHPSQMTLSDLRQSFPDGQKDPPTLLHYLVRGGHADVVFDALKRNPDDRLTAADMLTKSTRYRKTLLDAFAETGRLADVFTADVWQDRLEEMLSLQPHAEKAFSAARKVDFSRAAADVRARRLQNLKLKAPKLKLKGAQP